IVDSRAKGGGALAEQARAAGMPVSSGSAIAGVESSFGGLSVTGVKIASYRSGRGRVVNEAKIACDFIAMSGGFNPSLHLWCHNGGKLRFDETLQTFRPDTHPDGMRAAGAVNGAFELGQCLAEGYAAGEAAAKAVFPKSKAKKKIKAPKTAREDRPAALEPLWFSPSTGKYNEGNKHFIDFQNDVTVADLELAQREGYESVEHTKRYTTLGMATDQGKTSNVNALGVLADATGKSIPEIGTTTFRPPYTPFSFGSVAGALRKGLFLPIRRTPIFDWHSANGATFEPVGQWRRAYTYPRGGEERQRAINREIICVRNKVGLLDASTLGKTEIKGPDAAEFLDRMYTNTFS